MSYQQSSYPGAPGFPEPQNNSYGYYGQPQENNGGNGYNGQLQGQGGAPPSSSSSYYNGQPQQYGSAGGPGQNGAQQPVQYDEHGNPIPDGERGLGTMALGAIGGVAANKVSGDHHSSFKSGIAGALLAQGAKMAYEGFNKHNDKPHQGNPYGQPPHQSGGAGGFGSFFNKRDL